MNQERGEDWQPQPDATDGPPPDVSWGWRRPADESGSPVIPRRSAPSHPESAPSSGSAGPAPDASPYRPGYAVRPTAARSSSEPGGPVRPTRPYDGHKAGGPVRPTRPYDGHKTGGPVRPTRPYDGDEAGFPTAGYGGHLGAGSGPGYGGEPPPGEYGGSSAPEPPPWRRRPSRLVTILTAVAVVLVLLFVVVDRVAVTVAESEMAKQLRTGVTQGLACGSTPPTVQDVSIGGFPFLTQILFGKYKSIGVTVKDLPTPGPRIASVQATLKGVHVPLHQILTNSVGDVRVDNIQATMRVRYDDLNTYLAGQPGEVKVNPLDNGRRVEITAIADLPLVGAQEVGGVTTFEVRNNQVTLVPSEITLRGALNLDIPLGGLGELVPSIPLPVGNLPFRLTVTSASTDATGLSLSATAATVVLPKQAAPIQCPPAG
ncbi:DUF2993 domain-containing protein [Pseudofrankia sp. DC12]|uniref:LmeA family phospholipid-binding protein n=1 Tax=Pseudofrankia sp. DC12 TaxID=683315 RepID=UPI0005F7F003|nr:DUF2993 domain-containing protein [Pseudofrankia sp. DC12]